LFAVVGGGHPEPNKIPKNLISIKASMGPLWFKLWSPVVGNESAAEDWCKVSNNQGRQMQLSTGLVEENSAAAILGRACFY